MTGYCAPKRRDVILLAVAALVVLAPVIVLGVEAPVSAGADLMMGRGVDRQARALADTTDTFDANVGQVFCLARIVGADAPVDVTFVWYHEGTTMARVVLPVGSSDFRTWSSKNILPAWTGAWEVKVLDPKGLVLGETAFSITKSKTGVQ